MINKQRLIALDLESSDPYLKDHGAIKARGTSCVFGRGRIIVIGTYDGKQKKSYDGNGGAYVKNLFLNPNVTIIGANIQYDAVWLIIKHNINPKDVKCHFIDVSVVESLIDEYQKYDYHHRARMAIKPGITGLWQVSGRSNITDFEEVVRLDTEYITNWSVGLDLKILLKTILVIFTGRGAM